MRRLKISQPYATMLVRGLLTSIPDIWGDVGYKERIYIYAEEVDDSLKNGFDFSSKPHQKVWNEMTLDNIPDGTYMTEAYIGYVIITHTGEYIKYWNYDTSNSLYVNNAHEFDGIVSDYNTPFSYLDSIRTKSHRIKRMRLCNGTLIVPVSDDDWKHLINENEYQQVFLFWEDYMGKFIKNEIFFRNHDTDENEILFVEFKNKAKTINFDSGGVIKSFINPYKNGMIDIIYFDLEEPPYKGAKIGWSLFKEPEPEPKVYKSRSVRAISVPMGGMNKRR